MTPTSDPYKMKVKSKRAERTYLFFGTWWVGAAIWSLMTSIFLLDVWTHPENVSACFAYTIPIFMSLFEARPRPLLYAATATALSIAGSFIEPSSGLPIAAILGNRLIAIATQWLAALLVKVQYRRHVEIQRVAEIQRRFVDILSHEIGTALTAITGQAYRLTKLSGQLAPDDLKVRAEKIRSAAGRIETITNRVQFAFSLGDGTIPVGHRAVDINVMLRSLTDQLEEEQHGNPFELNLYAEPLAVKGDETLLRQAFENVVMNSVKYSSGDSPILISTTKRGSVVRIAIADRGRGIATSDLSHVREPYYRGSGSKGTSGAGLGLYLVERIVEAHEGTISIESEVGKGTKVTIELPQGTESVMR
ncbi:MAG: HAMP domain-containing sensor histidine kinase [Reyranella sp.]|nr:HAMP domain-containing sensor histidine kinase [Reyranella sp.]MDP2334402.1 HAMP domain-containing sensor histidine kinase [Reyranella sp.]